MKRRRRLILTSYPFRFLLFNEFLWTLCFDLNSVISFGFNFLRANAFALLPSTSDESPVSTWIASRGRCRSYGSPRSISPDIGVIRRLRMHPAGSTYQMQTRQTSRTRSGCFRFVWAHFGGFLFQIKVTK